MKGTFMFLNQHEKRGEMFCSPHPNPPTNRSRTFIGWFLGSSVTLAADGLATSAPVVHKPVPLSQTVQVNQQVNAWVTSNQLLSLTCTAH